MRSNYLRGRDREYYVMRKLNKSGAVLVKRFYGSKGPVDVVAVFPDQVKLIQVKKDRINREELDELKTFASFITSPDISVEVWVFRKRRLSILEL